MAQTRTPLRAQHDSEPDPNDHHLAAVVSRKDRRIMDLEAQIETLKGDKKKLESADTLRRQGRRIEKAISMFDVVEDLIREHDRRQEIEDKAEESTTEPETDDETAQQRQRRVAPRHTEKQDCLYNGYKLFAEYLPGVKRALMGYDPQKQGKDLKRALSELQAGAAGARSDDIKNMCAAVAAWLLHKAIPALNPNLRGDRGLNHDETGRLIRPPEYNWDDEDIHAKIRAGDPNFLVTADSWPAFLYPYGKLVDPEDHEKGLFKGKLLVKAYKHIFTSPLSAESVELESDNGYGSNQPAGPSERPKKRARGDQQTKRSVSSLIGFTSATPQTIAYAAVQLRFALSDAHMWNPTDGLFHYDVFYYNILSYFEAPPGPVARKAVEELLEWWTL
ncbi:hypothetical protein BD779DRAFT_1668413 [Infundibulicybe gibba]|nr:hypothetical protein BD779DRAFT_1668413 [Infundibulicybe gibba]